MSDIYDDDSFKKTTRQVGRQDQFVNRINITPRPDRTQIWVQTPITGPNLIQSNPSGPKQNQGHIGPKSASPKTLIIPKSNYRICCQTQTRPKPDPNQIQNTNWNPDNLCLEKLYLGLSRVLFGSCLGLVWIWFECSLVWIRRGSGSGLA